jgi:mannitol/fructose-specific phosphotransferase system IIA component (Ntr-type)
MSRDGLLPSVVQKTSRRFDTPIVGIALTGGFMILLITLLPIRDLVKVASTMMLMLFALLNLAVLIMRNSRIQNYRPLYKAPGHPVLQVAGIAVYVVLIAEMGLTALLATGAFLTVGVVWYLSYVRSRVRRESALAHLVRRAVSREVVRSELEDELRQIALERDQVTHDRFDHLVRKGEIMDMEGPVSADEMFHRVAERLAPRLEMEPEKLLEKLRQREAQSSTVVQPGLAIPHVIVEGERVFEILLLRCLDGVDFPGQDEPVRAVFVLVGSADERNYHLRALMAVAHIVQEHDFVRRWLAAGDTEHLRDLVLLSGRQRDEPDRRR